PQDLEAWRSRLAARAGAVAERGGFLVQDERDGVAITAEGRIGPGHVWHPERITLAGPRGVRRYARLEDVPGAQAETLRALVDNRGLVRSGLWSYWRRHGRLPPLDWALLAAFAAIAGAGGMSNSLFSNFARDKGWGMGRQTGAIPSVIGGRT